MTSKALAGANHIIPSPSYAGDLNSATAWNMLKENPESILVDVRTDQEWASVGMPDLSEIKAKIIPISFRVMPHMEVNKNFAEELEGQIKAKETPLFFICRSGGRSFEAASMMASRGYKNCYNIYDGFEGNPSAIAGDNLGWKKILPWRKA